MARDLKHGRPLVFQVKRRGLEDAQSLVEPRSDFDADGDHAWSRSTASTDGPSAAASIVPSIANSMVHHSLLMIRLISSSSSTTKPFFSLCTAAS